MEFYLKENYEKKIKDYEILEPISTSLKFSKIPKISTSLPNTVQEIYYPEIR